MAINSVNISGNIADEPKFYDKGETSVLRFPVAVNDRVKQNDEWVNRPNYVDVVIFGNRAKALNQWLGKGMKVAISGKLHQSVWKDKDDNQRYKLEVIAYELDAMTARKENARKVETETCPYDDIPF